MAKQALRFEHNGFKLYSIQNWLISGPFLVIKHVWWPFSKGFWGDLLLYYLERAQKAVKFWILCSLNPFCSNLRACLALFVKYNLIKHTFCRFWGWTMISGEIFVLTDVVFPCKGPKSSQIKNIVLFWPILLKLECLFGHFLEI